MTGKKKVVETEVESLQAEQSVIEDRSQHKGFRDASRRNRIQEQLGALDDAQRRRQASLPDVIDSDQNPDRPYPDGK